MRIQQPSCFLSFVWLDKLSEHSWIIIGFVFLVTLWYAFHDHRELHEKVRISTGRAKLWARSKLFLIWFMPILSLIAAVAAQVGADNADKKIDKLTRQVNTQSNILAGANIKPFKERLKNCLSRINPAIINSLTNGRGVRFKYAIEQSDLAELESLQREPGASEYILTLRREPGDNGAIGGINGSGVVVTWVFFEISPKLMQP